MTMRSVIDPASNIRIKIDPAIHRLTPAHWAYELVQAIKSGDHELLESILTSTVNPFHISSLTEPLAASGQTLLHMASYYNYPKCLECLFRAGERHLNEQAEEQRQSLRKESLITKAGDSQTRNRFLAFELDKINRVCSA